MRTNWIAAGLLAFGLVSARPVTASIRASFNLDYSSWEATHIVVVRTTDRDTVFVVVRSLEGSLKAGDTLALAGLKPDADARPISKYPKEFFTQAEKSEQMPRQPAGSEIILFLKKTESGDAKVSPANSSEVSPWDGATGGLRNSAIWIDGGKGHCFIQWMNPGPSALTQCAISLNSSDIAVLLARIQHVLELKSEFARDLTRVNPGMRAEGLGRIARSDVMVARQEAAEALANSGSVALPELLQIMDRDSEYYDGKTIVPLLVQAAGKDSGRLLTVRLSQDLAYWKTIAPTLNYDWLGQMITPGDPLYMKFQEAYEIVTELDREHYAPALPTVIEFRDFWKSQPNLYNPAWDAVSADAHPTRVTGLDVFRGVFSDFVKRCDDFIQHESALQK